MISAIHHGTYTLVVSRGQSRDPKKRELEQAVTEAAQQLEGVNVMMIPHLYDLPKGSDSYKQLLELEGNLIVVSWIYSRAAHWVLDRNGIQGQVGEVMIGAQDEEDDEENDEAGSAQNLESDVVRVTDQYPRPDRSIHCIDFKLADDPQLLVGEIRRIVAVDSPVPDHSLPIVGG